LKIRVRLEASDEGGTMSILLTFMHLLQKIWKLLFIPFIIDGIKNICNSNPGYSWYTRWYWNPLSEFIFIVRRSKKI